jgi:hypothetical protein
MPERIGDGPHPRALICGLSDDDAARVATLFPTSLNVGDWIESTAQHEWDVLVLGKVNVTVDAALCVISFGADSLGSVDIDTGFSRMGFDGLHLEKIFEIPDHVPNGVRPLAKQLGAILQQLPAVGALAAVPSVRTSMTIAASERFIADEVDPFLRTTTGRVLAGRFTRSGRGRSWWAIPRIEVDVRAWVDAALRSWANDYPDMFANESDDWRIDPMWQTAQERALASEIAVVDAQHRAAVQDYEGRRASLTTSLAAAAVVADEGRRRLLTAQSGELVEAVVEALTSLGFDVKDMDQERSANKTDLLEDLQVRDSEQPDWIVLAEVKGYARSRGKTQDFLKMGRHVARYVLANQKEPSGCWYIVNHVFEVSPSTRGEALQGSDDDVLTFAEIGGAVITTTDLFLLCASVERGDVDASTARATLRALRGRLPAQQ